MRTALNDPTCQILRCMKKTRKFMQTKKIGLRLYSFEICMLYRSYDTKIDQVFVLLHYYVCIICINLYYYCLYFNHI